MIGSWKNRVSKYLSIFSICFGQKSEYYKKLKIIRRINNFQLYFTSSMIFFIIVSLVGAWKFAIENHPFRSSTCLNVFGGLLTGLIVTIWSNITKNNKEKNCILRKELLNEIGDLTIPTFDFYRWTVDDENEACLSYEDADKFRYYTKILQKGEIYLTQLENNLQLTLKYFPLLDRNNKIHLLAQELKIKLKNIMYQDVLYPKPIFIRDEDDFHVITAEDEGYWDNFDDDCGAECDCVKLAFWVENSKQLEEEEYEKFILDFDSLKEEALELEERLKKEIKSCNNTIKNSSSDYYIG